MEAAKPRMNIFAYRIGRPFYWTLIVSVLLLGFVLSYLAPAATSGMSFVWMLIYAWRLHDLGRSGWWGVLAVGVTLLVGIGGLFLALNGVGGDFDTVSIWAMGMAILMQTAFTIWLGVRRGDQGPNRFGDRTTVRLGRVTL